MNKTATWLLRIHATILTIIIAILPVHAFISTWGGTALGPLLVWKSWKEILLAALIPLTVWLCALRPDIVRTLAARWFNWAILAYAILHGLWALASPASTQAVLAGLLLNLRFLMMFIVAQIVVAGSAALGAKLKAAVVPWLLMTTFMLAALAVLQVAVLPIDFLAIFGYDKATTIAPYVLVDQNPDAPRAFATLRGPNDLGAYVLLPLSLVLALLIKNRSNIPAWSVLVLGVVALALTGSRSAWLGMVAAFFVVAGLCMRRARLARLVTLGAVPLLLSAGVVLWLATSIPALRLAVFHSSPGDPSLLEGSSAQHWQATADGIANAVNHPLGQGVGIAGPAAFYNTNAAAIIPENYFVQIALEVGLLGLGLLVAICFGVAQNVWHNRRQPMAVALLASLAGVTVINMLLHGWADDPLAMTWWAIAGLYIVSTRNDHERTTPHKKTT